MEKQCSPNRSSMLCQTKPSVQGTGHTFLSHCWALAKDMNPIESATNTANDIDHLMYYKTSFLKCTHIEHRIWRQLSHTN